MFAETVLNEVEGLNMTAPLKRLLSSPADERGKDLVGDPSLPL